MEDLQLLALSGHTISDRVIGSLRELPLHELRLTQIRRTGGGLRALKDLRGLTHLVLTESPFTDDDIMVLRELPDLENICLDGTAITDKSLRLLMAMPRVKYAGVCRTKISAAGQAELLAVWSHRMQDTHGETGR